MKTTEEIAEWLKATAREMHERDENEMAYIFLDERHDYCLAVGWIGGYDCGDAFAYHSKSQPTYCLNAGIVKYNPADCCDMEWTDMPYDPVSGEVYDTESSFRPDQNWEGLADFYLQEYRNITKEIEKGTLV